MPTDPAPLTLAEAARIAAEIVDPDHRDGALGDFELAFEDADEPVRALDDTEARVATVLQRLDPAVSSGGLAMAGAIVTYLSYRRDEANAEPTTLLRLVARAEWAGDPPDAVRDWLEARGVAV
jgi:hypothetical protein